MMEPSERNKLGWMYKSGNDAVDREEYLLGKAVDKAFERSEFGSGGNNEIEKDCLPQSIFSTAGSDIQVDILRKKQEDPLEAIKQKEIELRKQLLKNPIKLKKLQNMLREQSHLKKKKKKKKKRHTSSSSSDSEKDLDQILASKYLKLVKKYGLEKLKKLNDATTSESGTSDDEHEDKKSQLENSKKAHSDKCYTKPSKEKKFQQNVGRSETGKNKSHRKEHSKHESAVQSQDSKYKRKEYEKGKSKPYNRRRNSTSSESSESDLEKKRYKSDVKRRGETSKESSRNYGLMVPENATKCVPKKESEQRNTKTDKFETKAWNRPQKVKLTEEEKERKRREMMDNAKWRDEVRVNNVKKYRKEEEEEKKKEKQYDSTFMRKQMSNILSVHGSVGERIKSNINSLQRTSIALDRDFTKR